MYFFFSFNYCLETLIRWHRQGQANAFIRGAPEKIPWAIQRYVGETERLYGVLEKGLKDRDWVVGPGRGRYSIWILATAFGS